MAHRVSRNIALLTAASSLLTACATVTPDDRSEAAASIAQRAGFKLEVIETNNFPLVSYYRFLDKSFPIRVYIEGDGHAYSSKTSVSFDPSPADPIALILAAQDESANVVYLARPCQFMRLAGFDSLDRLQQCTAGVWTTGRFSQEVVGSAVEALRAISTKFGGSPLELVGFSGGGDLAIISAAQWHNVRSVRTVASPIDHKAWTEFHEVSPLSESLNAVDYIDALRDTPIVHFLGSSDPIVPPSLEKRNGSTAGRGVCQKTIVIDGYTHVDGWIEGWRELLELPMECAH